MSVRTEQKRESVEKPTVNVRLANARDLYVNDAPALLNGYCQPAKSGHQDTCVKDGEVVQVFKQDESRYRVVVDLGIFR